MDTGLIASHDFDEQKRLIKDFSEKAEKEISLEQVKESKGAGEWVGNFLFGGGLGFKHRVTGEELNTTIITIQDCLKSLNQTQIQTIKEFRHIYCALEALDRDYIKDILFTVDEIKRTSEALSVEQQRINHLVEDSSKKNQKLEEQQNRIDENTRNNNKTLAVLKEFKKKLDSYSHLKDIDKIWHDCQEVSKEIDVFVDSFHRQINQVSETSDAAQKAVKEINKELHELSRMCSWQEAEIRKAAGFIEKLNNIDHLGDVDDMWTELTDIHESIQKIAPRIITLENKYEEQERRLGKLQAFIEGLSTLEHLGDVDALWESSNSMRDDITRLFTKVESYTTELDRLYQEVNENTSIMKSHIIELANIRQETQRLDDLTRENKVTIQELDSYRVSLSEKAHLNDIDDTWVAVQNQSEQLQNLREQNQTIQKDFEQALAKAAENTNTTIQNLAQKLKYAYILAGSAIGLAIIELMMLL